MQFFTELSHWTWWVLGVILIVLEVFAPTAFFLWMGISALVTGGLLWMMPDMSWTSQLFSFAVLSVISIVVWRRYFKDVSERTDQPLLNKRALQYVGRTFTLDEAIVNGVGQVRVDDSTWRISSDEDYPAGTRIQVIGEEGMTLKVAKAS